MSRGIRAKPTLGVIRSAAATVEDAPMKSARGWKECLNTEAQVVEVVPLTERPESLGGQKDADVGGASREALVQPEAGGGEAFELCQVRVAATWPDGQPTRGLPTDRVSSEGEVARRRTKT